jgi:uncharacterized membrane protein YvlD (DUF360 family)
MIARIVLALVVAIVVGLLLSALLGPILVALAVPIAVILGSFFVRWGWVLGILAGLWYFFAAYQGGWVWPWRTPPQ